MSRPIVVYVPIRITLTITATSGRPVRGALANEMASERFATVMLYTLDAAAIADNFNIPAAAPDNKMLVEGKDFGGRTAYFVDSAFLDVVAAKYDVRRGYHLILSVDPEVYSVFISGDTYPTRTAIKSADPTATFEKKRAVAPNYTADGWLMPAHKIPPGTSADDARAVVARLDADISSALPSGSVLIIDLLPTLYDTITIK